MKLSVVLNPKFVKCGLSARDKNSALAELVKLLASQEVGISEENILSALWERERLGPFSMGKGVAFPHARTDAAKNFYIVLGTSPAGLDFGSPDGAKSKVVVLFVIPKKHSTLYLQTLAAFLNLFSNQENLEEVASSKTPVEIISFIEEQDAEIKDNAMVKDIMIQAISLKLSNNITDVLELMNQFALDSIPVVDDENNYVGEISANTIIQKGVREHLLTLTNFTLLNSEKPFDTFLRSYGDTTLEGIINKNSPYKLFQEDEPILEAAIRMSKNNIRTGFVLKDKKLAGFINITDVVRRITGYKISG